MIKHLISLSLASLLLSGGCSIYKMEVQQGNYITQEELAAVQKGMSAEKVQAILGTPLLVDDFHKDRWDYIFLLKAPGEAVKRNSVTVFFQNGVVSAIRQEQKLLKVQPK